MQFVDWEEGGGNRRTFKHFNNKINKHKKSSSPSRTTATLKIKSRPVRRSSFNPSRAPPWDSRPVSGAGVAHYHLLHQSRSVPTALGPAPLFIYIFQNYNSCIYFNRSDRAAYKLKIGPLYNVLDKRGSLGSKTTENHWSSSNLLNLVISSLFYLLLEHWSITYTG